MHPLSIRFIDQITKWMFKKQYFIFIFSQLSSTELLKFSVRTFFIHLMLEIRKWHKKRGKYHD